MSCAIRGQEPHVGNQMHDAPTSSAYAGKAPGKLQEPAVTPSELVEQTEALECAVNDLLTEVNSAIRRVCDIVDRLEA